MAVNEVKCVLLALFCLANLKTMDSRGVNLMNTDLPPHSFCHIFFVLFFIPNGTLILFIMLIQIAVKIWHFKC